MARIYVYGSCVSRDSFDFLDKTKHSLIGYTARQSLISATGLPYVAEANSGALESRFQIRNLQGDFDGSIFTTLRDVSAQSDYIFWDLTDERLGVIRVAENSYITRSVELIQSGLLDGLGDSEWIKFGSEEHFRLWESAVITFAKYLETNALTSKIVLFNVPWSMYDNEGRPLQKSWNMMPDEANNLLARYVAIVRQYMNVPCIEIPWEQALSDRKHKWSLAPYHYQDSVYESVAKQFAEIEEAVALGASAQKNLDEATSVASGNSWHDSVLSPQGFTVSPEVRSFGLQFDARCHVSSGRRLLLSLQLDGAEDLQLSKQRLTKSVIPNIGHFRYVDVDAGERTYFAGFELPEGVSCTSIKVMGWQVAKGQVDIGRVSMFSRIAASEPLETLI
ncbi:DUF6270 domain-containing protein [Arthrobacter sp. SIMBA_036]|uniref:DUF6270 domain-containing protein n=1 Tax=Arthrobacter sp. SIMBA_036 TaxID=3085778 RepID=UPI00397A8498